MQYDTRKTILFLTPTCVPDPAAVGQQMAETAIAMARRGHRVVIYTSNRGYDNPEIAYPAREVIDGVEIRRLPFSSFGKSSFFWRTLGTLCFMVQCLVISLLYPRLACIVVTTSPPFSDLAGAIAGMVRRSVPVVYWAMDLYSLEVVAAGHMPPTALLARVLRAVQRFVLRQSSRVIALDRFMAERLDGLWPVRDRMDVIAPHPVVDDGLLVDAADNPFRDRHGLDGKFVIMYSGNHTRTNPLATLLEAAGEFRDDAGIRFLFVGGGNAKKDVEEAIARRGLSNAVSLPYQPLPELRHSLSAADVHVVSLGDEVVGIVHPCKVYGAMAVGRPILFLGPRPSHISDILDEHAIGWQVGHGDVAGMVAAIRAARGTPREMLARMGETAREALRQRWSARMLCGRVCEEIEGTMRAAESPRGCGVRRAVLP